jgi:hypothetical protein
MMAGFKRATKATALLRAAVFGPSGAGKTFTALSVAPGLAGPGGRIALIDTERGSASKYSDRFEFDVLELADQTVDGYVEAVGLAAAERYPVLIIDSLSHGWQSLLEEVEKLAKAKYRGNTWSAWSEGTPLQRKLVRAILDYPGHVIATMRSKTEWITVDDGKGRKAPQRVGLAPEQGKGIEYEFDLLIEISTDHIANVIKDRTGKFQDKLIEKPGKEFGAALASWLAQGAPDANDAPAAVRLEPRAEMPEPPQPLYDQIMDYIATAKDVRTLGKISDRIDVLASEGQLTSQQSEELSSAVDARHSVIEPKQTV